MRGILETPAAKPQGRYRQAAGSTADNEQKKSNEKH